jgi:hypothetical protein
MAFAVMENCHICETMARPVLLDKDPPLSVVEFA